MQLAEARWGAAEAAAVALEAPLASMGGGEAPAPPRLPP